MNEISLFLLIQTSSSSGSVTTQPVSAFSKLPLGTGNLTAAGAQLPQVKCSIPFG